MSDELKNETMAETDIVEDDKIETIDEKAFKKRNIFIRFWQSSWEMIFWIWEMFISIF